MEHPFEKYYQVRPLHHLVNELSDSKLEVERDRERINALVMSLVIQYLGEYLGVASKDPYEIGKKAYERKMEMRQKNRNENLAYRLLMVGITGETDMSTGDDRAAMDCLIDTASTAALFKEVAFNNSFQRERDFVGADFGSGTGILTLASSIAGRRSGAVSAFTVGLDREEMCVQRSMQVLSRALAPQEFNIPSGGPFNSRVGEGTFLWITASLMGGRNDQ